MASEQNFKSLPLVKDILSIFQSVQTVKFDTNISVRIFPKTTCTVYRGERELCPCSLRGGSLIRHVNKRGNLRVLPNDHSHSQINDNAEDHYNEHTK